MKALVALLLLGGITAAYADDHVIRPDCWEENVNGEVHRHCEVKRDAPKTAQPQQPPTQRPLYNAVEDITS